MLNAKIQPIRIKLVKNSSFKIDSQPGLTLKSKINVPRLKSIFLKLQDKKIYEATNCKIINIEMYLLN